MINRKIKREFDFDSPALFAGETPKGVFPAWVPWVVIGVGAALCGVVWFGGFKVVVAIVKIVAPDIARWVSL